MGQMGPMEPPALPQQNPQEMPPEVQLDQGQMPMGGQPPPVEDEEANLENVVDFALNEANLAKKLKNKKNEDGTLLLTEIGEEIFKGYTADETSRNDWMARNKEWLELALLTRTNKTFPWPKASNIKYPLLATAAMQFSARAYPALVPSDGKVVKAKVIPYDPEGLLATKAEHIARHMSYQVMCEMNGWEEDMDKLLMTMAISGICFKKTYHDSFSGKHQSNLVYPENFCVNYWAKSLEKAYRKTEILFYTQNEYMEQVLNNELFLDIGLEEVEAVATQSDQNKKPMSPEAQPSENDGSTPHVFYSCHTFWDLDGDGYEEPYIITIHKDTHKVVRITARWDQKGITKNENDEVVRIEPVESFTAFPFIPNPDGSLYSIGFGILLGPLNESVNSIINQLVDSGTLNNLQSGFIGKGLRLKVGQSSLIPGEWKVVNATGDDLHKSIFPLPTKEPSAVLLSLMNMLITSGNQLASIAEIFVGKMPGQNTPATTTQETVKQGMAVFTAIYKRVYRALEQEFKKLYRLNRITPGIVEMESKVLGIPLQVSDYTNDSYIVPGGDPTGDSETTKMMKVQQVGQMLQFQTIDPMAYTTWSLEAMEIPRYQGLLMKPQPPQPDPKQQEMQMKMQIEQQKAQMDQQAKQADMQFKEMQAQMDMQMQQAKLAFEQTKQAMELQGKQQEMKMDQIQMAMKSDMEARKAQRDMQVENLKSKMDLQATKEQHKQKIEMGRETLKEKKKAAKATPKKG